MSNYINKIASAIKNDLYSGLQGLQNNLSLSTEQLEDDIIDERLQIIKEYQLKGILPVQDLLLSINCIDVDCASLDKCKCTSNVTPPMAHFQIPQIIDTDTLSIQSIDRQLNFRVSASIQNFDIYNKYRKRNKNVPFVFIDITPNASGFLDCYIFNAPLIKKVTVSAIFKDPRQLENYDCCPELSDDNLSAINNEIKKRLTIKKLQYYRQYKAVASPNDQKYQ